MSTWNYRLVKYAVEGAGWGIHEVYYDDSGRAYAMTEKPCTFAADIKGDVIRMLEMALDDAVNRYPFLEPGVDDWPVTEDPPYGKLETTFEAGKPYRIGDLKAAYIPETEDGQALERQENEPRQEELGTPYQEDPSNHGC